MYLAGSDKSYPITCAFPLLQFARIEARDPYWLISGQFVINPSPEFFRPSWGPDSLTVQPAFRVTTRREFGRYKLPFVDIGEHKDI